MPTAAGSVKYNGDKLNGTFDVDGIPRYFTVDVKPRGCHKQPFECGNAILTYNDIARLAGQCTWKGTAGRDRLKMDFGGGIFLDGPLDLIRSTIQIRGEGTWSTIKQDLPSIPVGSINEAKNSVSANTLPQDGAVQDRAKIARELELIHLGVPIIAIFGQSGSGKSSFINLIASDKQEVGKDLHSCTRDVNVVAATVNGKRVVVIDTPGIDDTRPGSDEVEVLAKIANHLGEMGERKIWVTGVLFLHRINDNRFSQPAQRISNMLKRLCGHNAMNQLTLCTTMWDTVPEEEGNNHYDELCRTGAWKEMISKGAGAAKISNISSDAKVKAEEILDRLITNVGPIKLNIQNDMIKKGLKVAETGAGRVLTQAQKQQKESDKEVEKVKQRKGFWKSKRGCVIQ